MRKRNQALRNQNQKRTHKLSQFNDQLTDVFTKSQPEHRIDYICKNLVHMICMHKLEKGLDMIGLHPSLCIFLFISA